MKTGIILATGVVAVPALLALSGAAWAASPVQVGATGKTFASSAVQCAANPATGSLAAFVEAGLFNPPPKARGSVSLNGTLVANVTGSNPSTTVWLADGDNNVVVALNRKTADSYAFNVQPGLCNLPDTSGNTFSPDGFWEYAASGKSYASVTPGCAWNPSTGLPQPYVHLVDNGNYLLNVSVNGVALTQLSTTHPNTPVYLSAGLNVISAANGFVSTDYYVRDGGDGSCVLP